MMTPAGSISRPRGSGTQWHRPSSPVLDLNEAVREVIVLSPRCLFRRYRHEQVLGLRAVEPDPPEMSGKPSASCICTETPFFSVSPRVNDLDHYLAFPPGERCEARPERTQGLFILAPSTIAREAEVDRRSGNTQHRHPARLACRITKSQRPGARGRKPGSWRLDCDQRRLTG